MGRANCRFKQDEGCTETGSEHYEVFLSDLGIRINVPIMWKHYAQEHLVQPTEEERETVMKSNPKRASGKLVTTKSIDMPRELNILYVERLGRNRYTHEIGTTPDSEFIEKLETLLGKARTMQTFSEDRNRGTHAMPYFFRRRWK